MSIKQMVKVWEHEFTHPQLVVMLALADHADDDGENIFPSIERVAWKTGYTGRTITNILGQLRASGVLRVVRNYTHDRPTEYLIDWSQATQKLPFHRGEKTSPLAGGERGVTLDTPQLHPRGERGVTLDTPQLHPNHHEPSINHQEPSALLNGEKLENRNPEDKPEPPPSRKKTKPEKFDARTVTLPACVSSAAWLAWCEHRRELRKPLTLRAVEGQLALLAQHPADAEEMLTTSIRNGYQGIFPLKNGAKTAPVPTSQERPPVGSLVIHPHVEGPTPVRCWHANGELTVEPGWRVWPHEVKVCR